MRVRTRPHCLESAHSVVERKIFHKNDIPLFHVYTYIITMSASLTRSYWGHAFCCVHKDIRNVDKVTVPGRPIDWQWFCGHFDRQARLQVAK